LNPIVADHQPFTVRVRRAPPQLDPISYYSWTKNLVKGFG